MWDGVRRRIDEREAEQAARREVEDAAPPPPPLPKRRRRPRTAGARPRTSNAGRAARYNAIYKSPPPILGAAAAAIDRGRAGAGAREAAVAERRPAPMPPAAPMNGVMLKLRARPAAARATRRLERGFTPS